LWLEIDVENSTVAREKNSKSGCIFQESMVSFDKAFGNSKEEVFNGCFTWMIPTHYMKKWVFHQTIKLKLVVSGSRYIPYNDLYF